MTTRDDLKAKLKQKSAESVARTNALLASELSALKNATKTDLEALRPKVADQAAYDQLIAVIGEATQNNMDLAKLQERLEALGSNVMQVGKEAVKLLTL